MTEREHTPYHERRLEQQTLDALLRIEELMTRMVDKLESAFNTDLQEVAEDTRSASMMTSAEITEKRTKGNKRK
jgi:hypothetical protein